MVIKNTESYIKWFNKSLNKLTKLYKKDKEFFLKVAYQSSVKEIWVSLEDFMEYGNILKDDIAERLEYMIKDPDFLRKSIINSKLNDYRYSITNNSLKDLLDD